MKICLINPSQTHLFNPKSYPPLGLMYLSSVLKMYTSYDVTIYNRPEINDIENFLYIPEADIYGITVNTATLPAAKKLISFLKKRCVYNSNKSIIVIGGIHPTVDPKGSLEYTKADYVFTGEAEFKFKDFCIDYCNDNLDKYDKIVECGLINDLNKLPFPDRFAIDIDIIQDKSGIHLSGEFSDNDLATTIVTTRGCPYNCSFCCKCDITKKFRKRKIENIFAEIINIRDSYGIHQFRIVDDMFTTDWKWTSSLMDLTANQDVYFTTILRADSIKTIDQVKKLYDGGVRVISIGVENGDQKILDKINKKETIEEIKNCISLCKEVGIKTKVFIIFGLPGETLESIEKTKQFFIDCKPDMFTISTFIPLPGSDIFNNPKKYDIEITIDDYQDFFFYYEPDETNRGFHTNLSKEIKNERGKLITWLRSREWMNL